MFELWAKPHSGDEWRLFDESPFLLLLPGLNSCTLPSDMPSHLNSDRPYVNVGEMITFSCDEGYFIDGSGGLICMVNQTWSGDLPTCAQALSELEALYWAPHIYCCECH